MLTSDEKWILYDTPRRHPRILSLTLQNQPSMHARLCFVPGGQVVKRFTMNCCSRSNWSLQTCTCIKWNMCITTEGTSTGKSQRRHDISNVKPIFLLHSCFIGNISVVKSIFVRYCCHFIRKNSNVKPILS